MVHEKVDETFDAANEILDRHVAIVRKRNRKAQMVLLQGNHDYRAISYAERYPHLRQILDVPRNLRLKERKVDWVECWAKGKLFKLGHAHFTHGLFVNKYHAAKMVDHFGVPIYYGHTHDVMTYPKVVHGEDKTLEGGSLGCLCLYAQRYLKGAPTNWQQAVTTMFLQPNGNYNLYISRIFNHRFVGPDGVMYGAK